MKPLFYTLITMFISIQLTGQIEFREGSWSDLLEMAKAENTPIFVDAFAVWCGPCKRMDSQVFSQPEVGNFFNDNFINAKIDMEKGEGPALGGKYGVSAYPTILFIAPNGELLHKAVGYQPADILINNGKIALRKTNEAEEYTVKYEAGERDPAFVLEYMKQLNKAEKPTEKVALEYFQQNKDVETGMKAQIAFEALENMDSQLLQYLLEGKNVIKDNYDQSIIDEKLIEASQSTINTAVEFNAPSVFQQMVKNLESLEMSPDLFNSVERTYFAKVKDEDAYRKSIEQSLKKEDADPGALAMEIYQSFPQSKSMLQYARKIFDPSFPMNMSLDNYVTGLSLAIGLQDKMYMEQLFETMKMKSNPAPQETRQVEGLYQKAKSYLTHQMGEQRQGN